LQKQQLQQQGIGQE